jgi:hypothetical protein
MGYNVKLINPLQEGQFQLIHKNSRFTHLQDVVGYEDINYVSYPPMSQMINVIREYVLQVSSENIQAFDIIQFTLTNNTTSTSTFNIPQLNNVVLYHIGTDISINSFTISAETVDEIQSYRVELIDLVYDGSFDIVHSTVTDISKSIQVNKLYEVQTNTNQLISHNDVTFTLDNYTSTDTSFMIHTRTNVDLYLSDVLVTDFVLTVPSNGGYNPTYRVQLQDARNIGQFTIAHSVYGVIQQTIDINQQYLFAVSTNQLVSHNIIHFTFTNRTLSNTTYNISYNNTKLVY